MNRFTRAAVMGLVLATTAVPLAAEAQSRRDYRREMSQEMDSDEISEAQRAARRWIDTGVVKLAA